MSRLATALLLCASGIIAPARMHAQTSGQSLPVPSPVNPSANPSISPITNSQTNPSKSAHQFIPMPTPVLSPGVLELLKLEGEFSDSVVTGGGKAFASWFAEDGVTLNNGQPAVRGRSAIATIANWDPVAYRLSWYAEGAQMGPSNDTGFTWGHYDATTTGKDGKSTTVTGRYITFWKKVNGAWKVALDASANEPPPTNGLPTP